MAVGRERPRPWEERGVGVVESKVAWVDGRSCCGFRCFGGLAVCSDSCVCRGVLEALTVLSGSFRSLTARLLWSPRRKDAEEADYLMNRKVSIGVCSCTAHLYISRGLRLKQLVSCRCVGAPALGPRAVHGRVVVRRGITPHSGKSF